MKIEKKDITKLLEIVKDYPKTGIYHLNNNSIMISEVLDNFCKEKAFDYDLFCSDDEFLKKVSHLNPHKLNLSQARYNRHAKLYDFVFINHDINTIQNPKAFWTKIYHICKNGADILVFLDNSYHDELEKLLEELNFVASNYIDISSEFKVLSVRKMHGWGVYDMM